ncbi:hypothetical protein GE09DRAFT_1215968 [Coniochaeta sp. 2T2.1]|nr:hypothetical protein GE09DRAFT_1215968 [Coniochaeta sp. 2T2.1]
MGGQERVRRTKTNIVRTRTGCQNCRKRRRKCDEGRPECQGCVKRNIKCSGYERTIAFKDVSGLAAESSRKFEAARWAALRAEDEQLGRKRRRTSSHNMNTTPHIIETLPSDNGSDHDGDRSSSPSSAPTPAPIPRRTASPRQHRRVSSSSTRLPVPDSFEQSNTHLPPVDPALFNSPLPSYHSPSFDDSPSFDITSTSTDSPPTNPSTLITYNSPPDNLSGPSEPTLIIRDSPEREAALIRHFETHVLTSFPVPMTFGPSFMSNSCFRHAILALSSVNQSYLDTRTHEGQSTSPLKLRRSAVGREHYLCAVSELYRSLDLSDPVATEQHAAAALMLAYYEIETGSPFGTYRHAKGLDALLSKLDLSSASTGISVPTAMPQIFKAWRILRYDMRYFAMPYRISGTATDAHDAYAFLDPQLAIRDTYTLAWQLCGRVKVESSFTPSPESGGASKQAAFWIRDTARRVCDIRNVAKGDYHLDSITGDEVLRQCERLTRSLDTWHATLRAEDKPAIKAGGGNPFVTAAGGTAFEPIAVLTFAGGDKKAFEYMMYVTSRLIISYLLTLFGGPQHNQTSTPPETAAWAHILYGVVCGMQHKQMAFSYINPINNVAQAAMLCEGVGSINALLEGVIPYVFARGVPVAELADWLYLKKGGEIVRRERLRGKNIRAIMLTLDEDYEKGEYDTRCGFIAFGDYNGRGHFRDLYPLDG